MKVRNLFVALALTASALSIGATGALADTVAPVNNGGDASAPPGCPMGTVRDATNKFCTANGRTPAATTNSTTTATTATSNGTGTVAGTNAAAGLGAPLANTGTPVTPLLLGFLMLALGGLVVLRTRSTA